MRHRAFIVRLTELPDWHARAAELDRIFFEASLTKQFANEGVRAAFRERWLGRFIANWPELAHVAVAETGPLTGYIIGSHGDPARDPAFADIGFYQKLAHLTPKFPAHLHINLAPEARNQGTGSALVAAFMNDARALGLPGAHLVTGRDSRNRSFYARNGFSLVGEIDWGGTPIVMLARSI